MAELQRKLTEPPREYSSRNDRSTLELYEQLKSNGFKFPTKGGPN